MIKRPDILDNTEEEEAEIAFQNATDPDAWATAPEAKILKRGRPAGQTKEQVTVRLDKELIRALKTPDPKGWQARLNRAAIRGLGMD